MNMTPDQIEQWKDACNALRDGERIQVQLLSGEWSDTAIFDPRLPHRRKPKPAPWSLADHMRRFFPTWDEATMPLHRTDWTEDMLPDGWRPLLKGEAYKNGDEFKLGSEWRVETNVSSYQTTDYCHYHTRTRRPLPKAAPWTLPPPPAGQQWHRTDWTEDMLPEGWRPLLYDEIPQFGDQVWEFGKGPWGKYVTAEPRHSAHNHTRTMRPLSTPPRMVLEKIKAKCQANLALAKKRTQGNWTCVLSSATEATVRDEKALIVATANQFAESFGDKRDDANAAYIAACASDAEAGWRSTIAAIEWLQKERNATGLNASEWRLEQAILAAWK